MPGENLSPTLPPLEKELRDSLESYCGESEYKFVPNDAFDRIIQIDNITKELERAGEEVDAHKTALEVMGAYEQGSGIITSSRRKIFAILVLIEKATKITQFIDSNICDERLPFSFLDKTSRFEVRDVDGTVVNIDMFMRRRSCEGFRDHQWKLLAPLFELSERRDQDVRHYDLNMWPGLPFLPSQQTQQIDEGGLDLGLGGYAEVRKVKIHPAHYSCSSLSLPGVGKCFAVKRLRNSEQEYQQQGETHNYETKVLNRLNYMEHKHIIRLLATFSYGNHYHMIFPWADGNLQDFWKSNHPDDHHWRASNALATWMCEQMIGLTDALVHVHHERMAERNERGSTASSDVQIYGRHGDIKPENILWFRNVGTDIGAGLGVLKLADFGLADFHSKFSKSGAHAKGVTGTYQAPEIDAIRVVSPKYDIWSLGCVLMEFAVWYVHGWTGVDEFSQRRERESMSSIMSDIFYDVQVKKRRGILGTFQRGADTPKDRHANVKASVADINAYLLENTQASATCSDFALDVLSLVQTHLLRMNPRNRADCRDIIAKLMEISKKCQDEPYYSTRVRRLLRQLNRRDSNLFFSEEHTRSRRHLQGPTNIASGDGIGGTVETAPRLREAAFLPAKGETRGWKHRTTHLWRNCTSCLR